MASGEKTEKATPKKRREARQKGQVARSTDLQGAVVLIAGIVVMGSTGASMVQRLGDVLRTGILQARNPELVSKKGLGPLMETAGHAAMLAVAPIALACVMAGVLTSVGMVGFKPSTKALKPDPKRINPKGGLKNMLGPNALVETAKSISKVGVVAAIVAVALLPKLPEFGGMVGISPVDFGTTLSSDLSSLVKRAAFAYLLIGVIDFAYQKKRTEKSLKMDKEEVKQESKGQNLPAEVSRMLRRRQFEASRKRMMADVPTADVIVTNPTHYSVALRYDGSKADAPEVIAKGKDHLAMKIREIAREHGVPIVPDPPLARSLYAGVEVGQFIPEQFFAAVASLLAFVYRTAARRAAA